jgi:FO synthase subunit 1
VGREMLMSIKRNYSRYLTYSRNVFIPLTRVCRNRCGYCTFRRDVDKQGNLMSEEEVMGLVRRAEEKGCHEALLTYGESADEMITVKKELEERGYRSMTELTYEISRQIVEESQLMVHTNAGLLSRGEQIRLRKVTASMGLMLESSSERLMGTIAHADSPGKDPSKRKLMIEQAGELKIPFTTGLLIGIGETDEEIYSSLKDLRAIQDEHGHLQEIIIQNFLPKPNTPMERYSAPSYERMASVVALARMMFPDLAIQLPPNLNIGRIMDFLALGVDDLGGLSPVSIDHVNPEMPWPIGLLEKKDIKERLPTYPQFIDKEYLSDINYNKALSLIDDSGYVRK